MKNWKKLENHVVWVVVTWLAFAALVIVGANPYDLVIPQIPEFSWVVYAIAFFSWLIFGSTRMMEWLLRTKDWKNHNTKAYAAFQFITDIECEFGIKGFIILIAIFVLSLATPIFGKSALWPTLQRWLSEPGTAEVVINIFVTTALFAASVVVGFLVFKKKSAPSTDRVQPASEEI